MEGQRYRLREGLEIEYREGAPKSRGKLRFYNPDVRSPKSRDGAVYLDVEEVEVLFEPVPCGPAPECPVCGASSSLDSDMEPYCSARCRRDDGQERCEGCGKWFEMTEGRSDDDGVWLCGDCAPVLEEPAPEWKRSSEMGDNEKNTKGYAICPEWSNGVPWCVAEACPAFQGDDVPICALAGHLPPALYPVIYATVCVPEVQRWTRERSCPTPDEDQPSMDTPVDAADWVLVETMADLPPAEDFMADYRRILALAVLELRESHGNLREARQNDEVHALRARSDIRERLANLERNSVQVGDRLTLVTENGYECVMTVRGVE